MTKFSASFLLAVCLGGVALASDVTISRKVIQCSMKGRPDQLNAVSVYMTMAYPVTWFLSVDGKDASGEAGMLVSSTMKQTDSETTFTATYNSGYNYQFILINKRDAQGNLVEATFNNTLNNKDTTGPANCHGVGGTH